MRSHQCWQRPVVRREQCGHGWHSGRLTANCDLFHWANGAQFGDQLGILVSPTLCQSHEELVKVHNFVGVGISCMEDEVGPVVETVSLVSAFLDLPYLMSSE